MSHFKFYSAPFAVPSEIDALKALNDVKETDMVSNDFMILSIIKILSL